jgi:hypothetical protein
MYLRPLFSLLLLAILLAGCSKPVVKPQPAPVAPVPTVIEEKPQPGPRPRQVEKKLAPPPVVILVSEAIPAYQQVADELEKQLSRRATLIYLSKGVQDRREITALLKRPEYQQFVAVGLEAAREAKTLLGEEDLLVFCQVFNYQDYSLTGPRAKGVGALPGTAEMFASWRSMAPGLKSVGVITGPGLKEEIASAAEVAGRYGIELRHKVVATDKELLFEYKQMAPAVQGLWLLPDNRVLSGRTIRELMSFSVRSGKQVVVFSDAILRLGGLMSVTARPAEIAAKVVERLQAASQGSGIPGPDLLLLEGGELQINRIAARRYNLKLKE